MAWPCLGPGPVPLGASWIHVRLPKQKILYVVQINRGTHYQQVGSRNK